MAQIEFQNVSFAYSAMSDRKVLDDVSFQIEQGQFVTICGRSGSGKSTLLKQCKTVLMPSGNMEGKVYVEGRELAGLSLREQTEKIGYVMQDPENQAVTDKVWHELAFGLESLGLDTQVIRREVAEMASFFGIQNWFYRDVKDLSGGEKQLLNLASVMVMHPDILILDEPVSQLDPVSASRLLNAVKKIHAELGVTILISEHCLEEVLPYSDLVLVLDKGKLVKWGEPGTVSESLWHEWKKNTGIKMFAALPVVSQIFLEANGIGKVPMTVREGRQWLEGIVKDRMREERTESSGKKERVESGKASALVVKDIWYHYNKCLPEVLKGASFSVEEGEMFALVGGNGTGKTTMLKVIAQLLKPSSGKIHFWGKDVSKRKNQQMARELISVLPQQPLSLFVKESVREELEEMTTDKTEIERVVGILDLTDILESHPYDLSGGEQQRAALAKVLLRQPKLLLLDEPTKGMDIFYREHLAEILKQLQRQGVTIVMISHDIEFCAKYADRVAMFFDGTVIASGRARDFFSSNHFYTTAASRISRNIWDDVITKDEVVARISMLNEYI